MEKLLFKTGEAMLVLLSIFVLGIFVPFLISAIVAGASEITLGGIIANSVPFWIGTIIGWFISAIYINDILKN